MNTLTENTMARITKYFFIIAIIMSLFACSGKLTQAEYVKKYTANDGPLCCIKSLNKVKFTLKIQPPELATLLKNRKPFESQTAFESDKKANEQQLGFILTISDDAESDIVRKLIYDEEAFAKLMAYSNSDLQKDFELELDENTAIPCAFVHTEPANSIQPFIRISGVFQLNDSKLAHYRIGFNDNIFNTGKIKFLFNKEKLENLPQISI
ncbi:MAG: hypothetical protein IT236_04500 [Bacteroidia bacterium]|nr:hypothetical protein [Bacteroidia bacterium]